MCSGFYHHGKSYVYIHTGTDLLHTHSDTHDAIPNYMLYNHKTCVNVYVWKQIL